MEQEIVTQVGAVMDQFRMPRYREIPDVGLYLEQVTKYINDALSPMMQAELTGSMISNYVKKGLIASPVKKQYNREQIAYLIYIATVKAVLPMEDIRLTLSVQRSTYSSERAYDYFCAELENMLAFVFERRSTMEIIGEENSDEKMMLRNTIITVAHKVYLDKLFAALRAQKEAQNDASV